MTKQYLNFCWCLEMSGVIAVHCGAGTHNIAHYRKYKNLSKKACRKGIEALRNGSSALEAVKTAIKILENDPLTNCGYGSNLTDEGDVENDASVMDGKSLLYGGCGAVTNVKNPIELAYEICLKQSQKSEFGLIPPSLMVGRGAVRYAKTCGLKTVKNKSLISAKAAKQHGKYKKLIDGDKNEELLDTVGAVCMDNAGNVAAGCSSGGILLKKSGRVGQAALYASGAWADNFSEEEPSVAVCTSGCGEYLVRTQLAKVIAEDVKNSSCPTVGVSQSITDNFLNSRYLNDAPSKLCGALVLYYNNKTGDSAILWAHTTETMGVGFMRITDDRPKGLISELPTDIVVGTKVNVSGVYKYNNSE